jgi:hypothetical protein
MAQAQAIAHSCEGASLGDVLERVLNTGVVIIGDIKIKLCDIELLTIQIRLLICSVEKARELGIGWWWQSSPAHEGVPPPVARPPQPLPAEQPTPLVAKRCEADPLSPICVSRRGTQQEMALKSRKASISVERLV